MNKQIEKLFVGVKYTGIFVIPFSSNENNSFLFFFSFFF